MERKKIKRQFKDRLVVIAPFPKTFEEFSENISSENRVGYVIAGIEKAVVPASQIRRWLDLKRNSHSVILQCTDKLEMKKYLFKKDIPMTSFISSRGKTVDQVIEQLGLPVVSKIKMSSGGRGVQVIKDKKSLEGSFKRDSYFERFIEGQEGSVESFLYNRKILFSNITQYYKLGECNIVPAYRTEEELESINQLNQDVLKALNIKWGMTHLEYYLTRDGILFGEVALRPPGGYLMEALELAYGCNFWEAFIDIELGRLVELPSGLIGYAASIVIHPGVGIIESINGEATVLKLESLKKLKLKMKVGDEIKEREGVGEDYGYALLFNRSKEKLKEDIDTFYQKLVIKFKS